MASKRTKPTKKPAKKPTKATSNRPRIPRHGTISEAPSRSPRTAAPWPWGPLGRAATTGVNGNQGDNSAANSGAAYVFRRTGGIWAQKAYLKASNTSGGDFFGFVRLSADGRTLAVGAYWEDSNATGVNGNQGDNSSQDSGAVYVFRF